MRTICLDENDRRELTRAASVASGWALDGPTLEAVRDRARSSELLRDIGLAMAGGLDRDGAVLIKNAPSDEDYELATLIGLIAIPSTIGNGDTLFFDISPDSSRSTDLSGTKSEFPLHTDSTFLSAPHHLLGLACRQNSSSGGDSIMVSAADVVARVREVAGSEVLAALGEPVYPFYLRDQLVGHGVQRVPILVADGDDWRIRHRGDIVTALAGKFALDKIHSRALDVLGEVLVDPELPTVTVRLETDDLLLVDNRRVLHARTALGPGARRLRRIKGYLLRTAVGSIV